MRILLSQAQDLATKILSQHGYSAEEAEVIAEVIIFGSLRESSQGMNKLFGWHAQKDALAKEPTFTQKSQSLSICNAQRNSGMLANVLATDKVIKLVAENGLAAVGVANFNNSSGPLNFYTKKISQAGYIGIMFASADPIGGIAPEGFTTGVFGTNPLSISVPFKGNDITLDMSTAKYTWGDLLATDIAGESLVPGYAFDENGVSTTNPKEAMKGTVASFDGSHKGFGLAFMIQILAGALVGSVYEQDDEKCDYGSLLIALDPQKLGGQDFVDMQVEKMVSAVKADPDILLPGERGDARYAENMKQGTIPIDDELYKKITDALANSTS